MTRARPVATSAALVAVATLVLALPGLAPIADAHPWGRSSFERHESAGIAFLFAVVPDVPRAGHALPVHLELRDAANGTLLDARAVNATLREPAGAARPLALDAEGPGRFAGEVTVPTPGDWVVDVAWPEGNAGAAFAFHVYPDHRYRVDWLPMALEYSQAGVPGNVSAALWDDDTGEVLSPPPADAVLVVEAWSEFHEARTGRWEVPFPPSPEDARVLATTFTWPVAGAFDLRAVVPSLGLTLDAQPAFDVHALADAPPWHAGNGENAVDATDAEHAADVQGGERATPAIGVAVVSACAVAMAAYARSRGREG